MHAKVLNNTGAGTYGGIVEGMQWAVKNDADVISASLGAAGYNDAFINPVRNAQANGVIVVAAVGNGGSGTSGSPANVYDATAVGSVDVTLGYPDPERSTLDLTNDTVSAVSGGERIERSDWEETYNDTPDDWPDSYVVPDVTAPGNRIWSADTNLDTRTVENVDTADLTLLKGTSMATPHVAGVVALMESNSAIERSPAELQTALETTAVDIDAPATRQGVGRVDADDAVAAVATSPNITATISAVSNRVTAGRTLNVTSTVVNSGTEGGTTTLRLRLNETVVATTKTSVIAPGEQTTETLSYLTTAADTGTRTVTLSSDDNIDTQTVRIVEPRVELTNSSISPSRVDETNSTHTVTVLVHNISDDDRPDTITIAMPEQVVVGEVTTVTAVDTAGKSVPIAGIKADTGNTINVSISPDSNATIRDVRVTTAFTARRASS
jgi:subtilisin family serine protease